MYFYICVYTVCMYMFMYVYTIYVNIYCTYVHKHISDVCHITFQPLVLLLTDRRDKRDRRDRRHDSAPQHVPRGRIKCQQWTEEVRLTLLMELQSGKRMRLCSIHFDFSQCGILRLMPRHYLHIWVPSLL